MVTMTMTVTATVTINPTPPQVGYSENPPQTSLDATGKQTRISDTTTRYSHNFKREGYLETTMKIDRIQPTNEQIKPYTRYCRCSRKTRATRTGTSESRCKCKCRRTAPGSLREHETTNNNVLLTISLTLGPTLLFKS